MANLMSNPYSQRNWIGFATAALFVLFPLFANLVSQEYYVTFLTRVLIIGLAAIGLNIALGYSGMVSFGHSLYIGVGAYTVAIVSDFGISNAALHLIIALCAGAAISLVVGLVSLRTAGVSFIMITLAALAKHSWRYQSGKQQRLLLPLPINCHSRIVGRLPNFQVAIWLGN